MKNKSKKVSNKARFNGYKMQMLILRTDSYNIFI